MGMITEYPYIPTNPEPPRYPTAVLVTYIGVTINHSFDRYLWLSKDCYDYLLGAGDPYACREVPTLGSNQRVVLLGDEWDEEECWLRHLAERSFTKWNNLPKCMQVEDMFVDIMLDAFDENKRNYKK